MHASWARAPLRAGPARRARARAPPQRGAGRGAAPPDCELQPAPRRHARFFPPQARARFGAAALPMAPSSRRARPTPSPSPRARAARRRASAGRRPFAARLCLHARASCRSAFLAAERRTLLLYRASKQRQPAGAGPWSLYASQPPMASPDEARACAPRRRGREPPPPASARRPRPRCFLAAGAAGRRSLTAARPIAAGAPSVP